LDLLHRYVAAVCVHVRIDETRHQRAALDVDGTRAFVADALRRDFLDQPVGDAHVHALGALGVRAVEDAGVFEQQRLIAYHVLSLARAWCPADYSGGGSNSQLRLIAWLSCAGAPSFARGSLSFSASSAASS